MFQESVGARIAERPFADPDHMNDLLEQVFHHAAYCIQGGSDRSIFTDLINNLINEGILPAREDAVVQEGLIQVAALNHALPPEIRRYNGEPGYFVQAASYFILADEVYVLTDVGVDSITGTTSDGKSITINKKKIYSGVGLPNSRHPGFFIPLSAISIDGVSGSEIPNGGKLTLKTRNFQNGGYPGEHTLVWNWEGAPLIPTAQGLGDESARLLGQGHSINCDLESQRVKAAEELVAVPAHGSDENGLFYIGRVAK